MKRREEEGKVRPAVTKGSISTEIVTAMSSAVNELHYIVFAVDQGLVEKYFLSPLHIHLHLPLHLLAPSAAVLLTHGC